MHYSVCQTEIKFLGNMLVDSTMPIIETIHLVKKLLSYKLDLMFNVVLPDKLC